ncbi:hypothetical protein DL93DRAFT_1580594 [Clavulina sp. PMI_390]|nr:hypothetical protein DL93DRAFT_1580594 [Clavulina sp. PMI_390]
MRRKLNVIFQPLHTSDNGREGVIPPVVVATLKLRLPDCLTLVKISGHWLTFVEVEGGEYGWVYLSVVDLTSGQHWSSEWEPLRGIPLDIEVINNEYVTAAILRTPRHFRLLPNGEMLFLHSENGLLFPPPVLAPQLLAPYSSSGRPFFATWYETNDGVWYAEDELRPPSYSSSTTGLEPDSVGDTNSVPPHPQPPEAPLIIRNTSQVNAPIPPSVFGEPADWDPVARAWYEWGTKRGFRGLLVDMLPQPKRSAAPTKPSAISSLPISPKGYRFTRKPQMLAGCSYPGDARNCLSLVCPFTVVRDGFEEYPLADRANVVLTRVVRSTEKNGEKQLEHQLLMVRQSPKFADSQGASGELGDDHEVPGSKNEVRPLIVRSEEIVILWSTIAGVLVARERTLNGYQTVVYRFVTDPI